MLAWVKQKRVEFLDRDDVVAKKLIHHLWSNHRSLIGNKLQNLIFYRKVRARIPNYISLALLAVSLALLAVSLALLAVSLALLTISLAMLAGNDSL